MRSLCAFCAPNPLRIPQRQKHSPTISPSHEGNIGGNATLFASTISSRINPINLFALIVVARPICGRLWPCRQMGRAENAHTNWKGKAKRPVLGKGTGNWPLPCFVCAHPRKILAQISPKIITQGSHPPKHKLFAFMDLRFSMGCTNNWVERKVRERK